MKNFFDDHEYKCSKMCSKLQYRRVVFRIISDIHDGALHENCPNTEFFLLRVFLCSGTEYGDLLFSPNNGKYGPEKNPYLDTFHAVES